MENRGKSGNASPFPTSLSPSISLSSKFPRQGRQAGDHWPLWRQGLPFQAWQGHSWPGSSTHPPPPTPHFPTKAKQNRHGVGQDRRGMSGRHSTLPPMAGGQDRDSKPPTNLPDSPTLTLSNLNLKIQKPFRFNILTHHKHLAIGHSSKSFDTLYAFAFLSFLYNLNFILFLWNWLLVIGLDLDLGWFMAVPPCIGSW